MKLSKGKVKVLGLLAVPIAALALVMMVLSWTHSSATEVQADTPHAGLDFSMAVGGCDTKAGDNKCDVAVGATFSVSVTLNSFDAKYDGFDTVLKYSGVTSKETVSIVWPECAFPGIAFPPGIAAIGCGAAPPPLGVGSAQPPGPGGTKLYTTAFNCTASGSITMNHGAGATGITDTAGGFHAEGEGTTETLDINCVPATDTPTPTATPTPPPVPRWVKHHLCQGDPIGKEDVVPEGKHCAEPGPKGGRGDLQGDSLANLFLTRQGDKIPPETCRVSTDNALFAEALSQQIVTADPKDASLVQILGAFEFEVRYNEKNVCVVLTPGPAAQNMICFIQDDSDPLNTLEGIARMGCVTVGKFKTPPHKGPKPADGHVLAYLQVLPQPELYSQIRPNQDNGIVTQLLDQDCELADEQGHPIPIFSCEDADVTARYLEGDVEPDCQVNALDTQAIAFRWGASKGSLLYKEFMDLEPSGQVKGDGDNDIKDLQFVYGRFGSSCKVPHPSQPPANPKGA